MLTLLAIAHALRSYLAATVLALEAALIGSQPIQRTPVSGTFRFLLFVDVSPLAGAAVSIRTDNENTRELKVVD